MNKILRKKNNIKLIISIVILLSLILYFFNYIVFNYQCPFKTIFNIYCAGCGTTRMILSIFKLEFYQAFRYNPLIFIYFLIGVIYLVYSLIKYKKIKIPDIKILIIMIIISFVYMILRNTQIFSYLKPTNI